MASRHDEDLGMFSNLYQSLTDRGPNKRRIKPLEGNLLQMTFGMASSDEDDSDFVAKEDNGSDSSSDGEQNGSSQSVGANGLSSRAAGDTGKLLSLSDMSGLSDNECDMDADSEDDDGDEDDDDEDDDDDDESDEVSEDSDSGEKSEKKKRKMEVPILEQDFNTDSDSSFNPGEDPSEDSDSAKVVEKKKLRRRKVSLQLGKGARNSSGANGLTLGDMIDEITAQAKKAGEGSSQRVCSVCLELGGSQVNDKSNDGSDDEDVDDIMQCDNCGIVVHEACCGLGADSSSNDSSEGENKPESTRVEAWFCDPCRAGATPFCVLCLRSGPGAFKPTSDGRWVHTVCTLYTPGVAYGRVKYLSPVHLRGIARSRWASKTCTLCENEDSKSLGVCIQCDAGLCKATFHVTCAQRYGLLCEAPDNEVVADPFYALCHQHCDKRVSRTKMLRYQTAIKQCENSKLAIDAEKIASSLEKARLRFTRVAPIRLYQRSEGDSSSPGPHSSVTNDERSEQPVAKVALCEPVEPAVSTDFACYHQERNSEIAHLNRSFLASDQKRAELLDEKDVWEERLDKVSKEVRYQRSSNAKLRTTGLTFIQTVATFCQKPMQVPAMLIQDVIAKKVEKQRTAEREEQKKEAEVARKEVEKVNAAKTAAEKSKAAAAGKRRNVGRKSPKLNKPVSSSTGLTCCRCRKTDDCDNIIDCDRCHQAYHIYCLDPPLKKKPKKTSICGWQCLDCDTSDSDFYWRPTQATSPTEGPATGVSVTKRGRAVQNPTRLVSPVHQPKKKVKRKPSAAKRQRQNSILSSDGSTVAPPKKVPRKVRTPRVQPEKKEGDSRTECSVCKQSGNNTSLVRCDSCKNCFHFPCLDPPRKSCPKPRGYFWHCMDCDSSESESDNNMMDDCVGNEDLLDRAEAAAVTEAAGKKKVKPEQSQPANGEKVEHVISAVVNGSMEAKTPAAPSKVCSSIPQLVPVSMGTSMVSQDLPSSAAVQNTA